MNLESFVAELQSWATLALSYLTAPWFAYQLAIIVVLFGLAKLLSLRVEPRLKPVHVKSEAIRACFVWWWPCSGGSSGSSSACSCSLRLQ